jgi:hypothetical protein
LSFLDMLVTKIFLFMFPANEGYTKEEIYLWLLSILLLFIACVLFVALLITGLWLLHRRRHQLPHQVFAVVDGNVP